MTQREWTGIECWLCLQDNEGPAHEAGRSQVPNKQKEGVLSCSRQWTCRGSPFQSTLRMQGAYMLTQAFGGVHATGKPQQVQEIF